MRQQGIIRSVTTRAQGSFAVADSTATSAAVSVPVADSADYCRDGGTVRIDGATASDGTSPLVVRYLGVVESLTDAVPDVLLLDPSAPTVTADTLLAIYPDAVDVVAEVELPGEPDTVPAVVPHALRLQVDDGIRDPDSAEWVELERVGHSWRVADVVGRHAMVLTEKLDPLFVGKVTSADGKSQVIHSTDAPASGYTGNVGDTWFQHDAAGHTIAMARWDGTAWQPMTIAGTALANIDAGTVTSGSLSGIDIFSPDPSTLPRAHMGKAMFEVTRADGDGNPYTSVTLGGATADQLMLYDTTGSPLAGFDQSGNGLAQNLNVPGDIALQGSSLAAWMAAQPQGLVSAYQIQGGPQVGSSECGWGEIGWTAQPNHVYRIEFNGYVNIPAGKYAQLFFRANSGSNGGHATAPTISNTALWDSGVYPGGSNGGIIRCTLTHYMRSSYTQPTEYRCLLSMKNSTDNTAIQGNGTGSWLTVIDLGAVYTSDVLHDGNLTTGGGTPLSGSTASAPAAPKKTYVTTWQAAWAKSWQGTSVRTDVLGQGHYGSSQWYSMVGWTAANATGDESGITVPAALSGASVSKVEVRLKDLSWYYDTGGKYRIGHHGNNSAPASPQTSGGDAWSTGNVSTGSTNWFTLPSGWYSSIASGAYDGITLGEGAGTDMTFYGKSSLSLSDLQLRVTYTK